jgi:hypothetical protein
MSRGFSWVDCFAVMSAVGTKRRTIARHRFGRYQGHRGHAANSSGASIRRFRPESDITVAVRSVRWSSNVPVVPELACVCECVANSPSKEIPLISAVPHQQISVPSSSQRSVLRLDVGSKTAPTTPGMRCPRPAPRRSRIPAAVADCTQCRAQRGRRRGYSGALLRFGFERRSNA